MVRVFFAHFLVILHRLDFQMKFHFDVQISFSFCSFFFFWGNFSHFWSGSFYWCNFLALLKLCTPIFVHTQDARICSYIYKYFESHFAGFRKFIRSFIVCIFGFSGWFLWINRLWIVFSCPYALLHTKMAILIAYNRFNDAISNIHNITCCYTIYKLYHE